MEVQVVLGHLNVASTPESSEPNSVETLSVVASEFLVSGTPRSGEACYDSRLSSGLTCNHPPIVCLALLHDCLTTVYYLVHGNVAHGPILGQFLLS